MLGIDDVRRVAWRRRHAAHHYLGHLTLTDKVVRLSGREGAAGIEATITIPHEAIQRVRVCSPGEHVVGEASVVIELADRDPILIRPVDIGPLDLEGLVRRIESARGRTRAVSATNGEMSS